MGRHGWNEVGRAGGKCVGRWGGREGGKEGMRWGGSEGGQEEWRE